MTGNWNSCGGHAVFPRWSEKADSKGAWLKPVILFRHARLNRTKLPTWSNVFSTHCVTAINELSVQNCWYLRTQNVLQIRCINCNIRMSCLSQFSLISILLNINKESKHCDCRRTMHRKGWVFQIATFRSPKIRFIPLFSWNINQCCPVPWNIFGCSLGP